MSTRAPCPYCLRWLDLGPTTELRRLRCAHADCGEVFYAQPRKPGDWTRIQGAHEETACASCGWPCYTGDRAIMGDDGQAFCSRACEGDWEGTEALRPDEVRS